MKARPVIYGRLLRCTVCGGSQGTLVKHGQTEYQHQRPEDCEAYRKRKARLDKVLAERKSLPKEEKDAPTRQDSGQNPN